MSNVRKLHHTAHPIRVMPTERDIHTIPLARAGEYELSEKECKTLRSRIYALNKNNAPSLADAPRRCVADGMEDQLSHKHSPTPLSQLRVLRWGNRWLTSRDRYGRRCSLSPLLPITRIIRPHDPRKWASCRCSRRCSCTGGGTGRFGVKRIGICSCPSSPRHRPAMTRWRENDGWGNAYCCQGLGSHSPVRICHARHRFNHSARRLVNFLVSRCQVMILAQDGDDHIEQLWNRWRDNTKFLVDPFTVQEVLIVASLDG